MSVIFLVCFLCRKSSKRYKDICVYPGFVSLRYTSGLFHSDGRLGLAFEACWLTRLAPAEL